MSRDKESKSVPKVKLTRAEKKQLAQIMAQEIIPVPLDQRYGREDVERIIEVALEARFA